MRDFAIVTKIEGQTVEVVSLISNACINCEDSSCARQGKSFLALNKRNLPIKENSIVRIEVSRVSRGIQGISALVFPLLAAIGGYIFSPIIAQKYGLPFSENFTALCIASSFSIAAFIVFLFSRSNIHISLPEITQVL